MGQIQVSTPAEITADDLHAAYVLMRLRHLGIGMLQASEHPQYGRLMTAIAKKHHRRQQAQQHGQPAPTQQALI